MKSIDVHQHLWPDDVLRTLERRSEPPCATWNGARWRVDLPGEPSFDIDPADHDPEERVRDLGVDQALVALSSPVGIEALPLREAWSAAAAWTEVARTLPPRWGGGARSPSRCPGRRRPISARSAISDGAAGVCVAATQLATPRAAERALPLLEAVASAGGTAFLHPGPVAKALDRGAPGWWAPATGYVTQQHAAWHAFHLVVRPHLPGLRVIFALLAGLAPLHAERTALRSGLEQDSALRDPLTFYDTSSYGPRAVGAMATAVGIGQLVHGSDYPVVGTAPDSVEEAFTPGIADLVQRDSPSRALGHTWTPA